MPGSRTRTATCCRWRSIPLPDEPPRLQHRDLGGVIGRPLSYEELSPDEFRRQTTGAWPPAVADMLLGAWAATLGHPAFVTSAVHGILGAPPRTFRQWAVDHRAAFGAAILAIAGSAFTARDSSRRTILTWSGWILFMVSFALTYLARWH